MKNKVLTSILVTLSLMMMALGAVAQDEESIFSAEAGVDYNSKYIWRGQNLVDGSVIQPWIGAGVAVGPATLSASVWGNFDIHNPGGDLTEVDYTGDVSVDVGPVSLSTGWIGYNFPQSGGDAEFTQEVYFGVGGTVPIPETELGVDLGATAYWDFDDGDGWYFNTSASSSIPVPLGTETVGLSVDPGIS
ncbi:hypothetical protein HQ520_05295, partial [bacterium]|nr:hypothetical protein [bacterium]